MCLQQTKEWLRQTGRQGFEPWEEVFSPLNRLAGGSDRPLWHLPQQEGTIAKSAEGEGFEPPVGRPTTVFKTAAIVHSAIPPALWPIHL